MNPRDATEAIIDRLPMPPSFNNDTTLLAINLFLMTAFTYIGAMVVLGMISAMWRNRTWDKWNHPVTLHRASWLCASMALTLRAGAEAAVLWAWNPLAARASAVDIATAAEMQNLKRYLDPVSLCFAAAWIIILVLSNEAMVQQLRKQPFPIEMWARFPALIRPAMVVLLAAAMAFGVVWLRG